MFRLASHIDHDGRQPRIGPLASEPFGERRRGDPLRPLHEIVAGSQGVHAAGEVAGHVIEADAAEPHHGLFLPAFLGDHHDRLVVGEHRSRPRRILAVQGDIERAAQVAPFEIDPVADVEELGCGLGEGEHFVERQGLERLLHRVAERGPLLAVQDCVVDEVVWRFRLIGCHERLECLSAHRLEGVVELLLLADRGHGLFRQALATHAARPVSRIDERGVGQLHELVRDAVVEHVGELVGRHADARQEVRPAHVADEERVAGEHGQRLGAALRQVVDENRNALRRVARCLDDLELHVAKLDHVAVLHLHALKLRLGSAAEMDRRAGFVPQFNVAGDEVGMEVREEDVLDRVPAGPGVGEVLIDVSLGVDHRGRLRLFVGDHVRRVRQAGEVVLLDLDGDVSGDDVGMGNRLVTCRRRRGSRPPRVADSRA